MGTHPIFESDFDCLTENNSRNRPFLKRVKWMSHGVLAGFNELKRLLVRQTGPWPLKISAVVAAEEAENLPRDKNEKRTRQTRRQKAEEA